MNLRQRQHGIDFQYFSMILPQLIGFLVFSVYPIYWIIKLSFFEWPGFGDMSFVGVQNFVRIFNGTNPEFWTALGNTLLLTFGKLTIELPLALFLALFVNQKFLKGRNFFRTVFFLPTMISPAILALIFSFIFASHNGIINSLLINMNMIDSPINFWDTRLKGMLIIATASIWQGFGINMIFFLSGLQSIPEYLYESATLDGANKAQQLWNITLPQLAPVLQTVFMLAMVSTMKVADVVMVLTNGAPGGKTDVLMSYVYKKFFQVSGFRPQYGLAASIGVVSALIIAAITVLYLYVTRKANAMEE
ncbi:MAG: carbohydrate ABC transporter permease [Sphaerochaetaceae bacterium]